MNIILTSLMMKCLLCKVEEEEQEEDEEEDELGGLFKVLKKKEQKNNPSLEANMTDSSKSVPNKFQAWELEEVGQGLGRL
jgi:hypothetical protein